MRWGGAVRRSSTGSVTGTRHRKDVTAVTGSSHAPESGGGPRKLEKAGEWTLP